MRARPNCTGGVAARRGRSVSSISSFQPITDGSAGSPVSSCMDRMSRRASTRSGAAHSRVALARGECRSRRPGHRAIGTVAGQRSVDPGRVRHSSEYHLVVAEIPRGGSLGEMNPAALKMYKATRDQVIGRTTDEMLGPRSSRPGQRSPDSMSRGQRPQQYEFVYTATSSKHRIAAAAGSRPRPPDCPERPATSPSAATSRNSCANHRRWRRSVNSPAASRMTSTTCYRGISGSLELLKIRKDQAGWMSSTGI